MNEQRTQASLNLINQLLSCNDGDEPRILQGNEELLDQGLIEVMVAVARQYEEAGNENEARWLMNIARQLAQALGLLDNNPTESANTTQDYLKFLMETLQKISENPSHREIYPFLVQNKDKLNDDLITILESWSKGHLLTLEAEESKYIAAAIFNLSNRIREFPLGNIATNLEIAIAGYQIALNIFTFEASPQDWALAKNNLANAYLFRRKGDKAENIEKAIAFYQKALKVRTLEAFPLDWAATQNNLASAYVKRIKGDEVENIEKAITLYQEALKVRTFKEFPQDWADTQNNLSIAYRYRIRGDKTENLEMAILSCENALKVRTFKEFPQDWADIQNNIAEAYLHRIKGDKVKNLETAIKSYRNALRVYTFEAFPKKWAMTLNNLANACIKRTRDGKADDLEQAENLEEAITAYTEILRVYTFEEFPQDWADAQSLLGIAYLHRIRGDKSENLERTISCCQDASKVYTFETSPQKWATIQEHLGLAYLRRIRGDIAENLERAIFYFQEVLKVRNYNLGSQEWADTQTNLGEAYRNRIRGDIAENLERAIFYFQEALKVYTIDAYPVEWADTQNILGDAYLERIREDKAENIERAIIAYREALKVFTFDTSPQYWAATQDNLGIAYRERIRGDKAENIERAIIAHKEALKVFTFDAFPEKTGMTLFNLGNTYLLRVRGDRTDNIEKAINAYTEALKIRTFDVSPLKWAMTQVSLGNAYLCRDKENKEMNLERAIVAYTKAEKIYNFDDFPQKWAVIQADLGNVYAKRTISDKVENIERAINFYHNALQIWTEEKDPFKCLQVARNLGNLHCDQKQWRLAAEAYHIAVKAVENARLEALNPQSRQEVLSNAIDVFHGIVQAYLNFNQPEKALEYIERSKGRNLVELMTQKNLHPQGVSQEIIAQLNELKQRVVNGQICLQSQSINQNLMRSDNLTPYVQDQNHLKQYQQELDNFIEREIKPVDPLFSLTQKVEPIPFIEIQALTDAETCLLQWYITGEKILAFVVSADGDIQVWQSSEEDKNQLIKAINNYLQLYYSENGKTEWRNQLSSLLQTFADILDINDILTLIPDTCKRLIIVPHRDLHILPLHALPVSNSNVLKFGAGSNAQDLHDLFPNGVQYAPSCQLLRIAQNFHHSDFNKLLAIQNPTKDLLYTDLEVNILSNFFTESQIIAKDNATKNAIIPHLKSSNNHCHHFSCHGGFNLNNPLESALFLANKESLTLGEIFELRFNQCRLVTLSACETGLIDINSISDEYIGLPSGFLFAGSPSVVSSLWTVNDLSTSFLMIKFYEILFNPNLNISVAVALKQAQNWLQNLTVKEAEENLESQTFQQALIRLQQTLSGGDLFELEDAISLLQTKWKTMSPEDKPFNNPFYWAGFVASGV